ncbi:hypothetical protein PILCRDRAFT_775972 [Piloderma croceum F 1598]|uniref:Uncharacterized protein n=1 Tax=Piloderma croceum (strain F 1598) TaxID=765440 RepID=A0A0C3FPD3_PILCF|nr:hypothetical protein PILCRDRAFT_775972 [Piloderma croceum F 1598]
MTGKFSSRRLRRFLPRLGTQLAKLQEELETRLREAAADEGDSGEENEEDGLDIDDGVDEGSTMGDEDDEPEEMEDDADGDLNDELEEMEDDAGGDLNDEEDDPIVGNGFVEEVAEELEACPFRRIWALIAENPSLIGLKSGEYGGKNS